MLFVHQKSRWLALGSLLLLLGFTFSGLFVVGVAEAKQPVSPQIKAGSYQVVTTFLSGPKAGQQEKGSYLITQNGSLTATFDGVGTGYGAISMQMHPVLLSFRESMGNDSDVQVTQLVTSVSTHGFVSRGYGQMYSQDQPLGGLNQTVSVARMVPTRSAGPLPRPTTTPPVSSPSSQAMLQSNLPSIIYPYY